jgi:hypothetical protein
MDINEKLTKIQTEFKSKKSRFNSFGKYYFRSAEDILEATKPFLKELEVSVTINEELIATAGGAPVLQCTATIHDGEDSLSATAIVGVDLDQKGMQMPQRYGAASSYGKKYALGNLFLIDDTQDSDAVNTHGKSAIHVAVKPKSKLLVKDVAFEKALEFMKSGGSIEAIQSKYELTPAVKKKLEEAKNG